jgi:hypothetical protein
MDEARYVQTDEEPQVKARVDSLDSTRYSHPAGQAGGRAQPAATRKPGIVPAERPMTAGSSRVAVPFRDNRQTGHARPGGGRETAADKARRYLATGRLTVTRVDGDVADAIVRGDTGEHHVGHDPVRGWHCSCPAWGGCSHVTALKLVTVWMPAAVPVAAELREAS